MDIPSEFICPITMELMVHPVATRYGQNFERAALLAWLEKGSGECPLTRKPLKMADLINNNFLTKKIRLWKESHDVPAADKDERPEEVGEDDDVLIFMYGTAANCFQLPTTPSSPQTSKPSIAKADAETDTSNTTQSNKEVSRPKVTGASRPLMRTLPSRQNQRHQHMWFY